jgi:hypothetical protein
VAIRPAAIYGEHETRHLPRIVKYMDAGLFRFRIGDPAAMVDWLHVDNLVSSGGDSASARKRPDGHFVRQVDALILAANCVRRDQAAGTVPRSSGKHWSLKVATYATPAEMQTRRP